MFLLRSACTDDFDLRSLLQDGQNEQLLSTLINYLLRYIRTDAGPLVIRRLCSTLVDYFLTFSASWNLCIRHLVYCLSIKDAVSYSRLERANNSITLLQTLNANEYQVLLWFSTAVAEMVDRTDVNSEVGYICPL